VQPTPINQNAAAFPPYGDYYTSNYRYLWERDFPLIRRVLRVRQSVK
jgi:hypothetical protein